MRFANPFMFILLLLIPLYFWYKYKGKEFKGSFLASSARLFSPKRKSDGLRLSYISDILFSITLFFMVFALARPQSGQEVQSQSIFGLDIVLAIDVSTSMWAVDTIPSDLAKTAGLGSTIYSDPFEKLKKNNRLNIVKRVVNDYIDLQDFNRIGIVAFAGYSYTKAPLTIDKNMLKELVNDLSIATDNGNTAIGLGIANSINRLKNSDAKSKVIILLTDGDNNVFTIDPLIAADIAADKNIKIYTIGVGSENGYLVPIPRSLEDLEQEHFVQYQFTNQNTYNKDLLVQIAEKTGGQFFEAADEKALSDVYKSIDKLEKSKMTIKQKVLYTENFMHYLVLAALFFLFYLLSLLLLIRLP